MRSRDRDPVWSFFLPFRLTVSTDTQDAVGREFEPRLDHHFAVFSSFFEVILNIQTSSPVAFWMLCNICARTITLNCT